MATFVRWAVAVTVLASLAVAVTAAIGLMLIERDMAQCAALGIKLAECW